MAHLLLSLAFGCDVASMSEAEDRLLELDNEAARAALTTAEEGLSCGASTTEELARFWLLTAGLAVSEGDDEAVDEALLAAKAADATFWMPALGPGLEQRWKKVLPSDTMGRLVLLDLPVGYTLLVDGKPVRETPLEIPAGLHVVQALGGENGWGRVINLQAASDSSVSTGLPELPVEPEPTVVPTETADPVAGKLQLGFYAGLGISVAIGRKIVDVPYSEPGAKVGPWFEGGLRITRENLALRVGIAGELPLNGRYVFLDGDTNPRRLWVSPSLLVSGGYQLGPVEVGALVGAQLPSRVPLRLYGAVPLGDRFALEMRMGLSIVGSREIRDGTVDNSILVEPGGALLASLRF